MSANALKPRLLFAINERLLCKWRYVYSPVLFVNECCIIINQFGVLLSESKSQVTLGKKEENNVKWAPMIDDMIIKVFNSFKWIKQTPCTFIEMGS